MYAKYQTDALVLGTVPHGEADARVTLYTKAFGLVHVRASSLRRESSRMRYGLQSYMRSHVSLVRGASGWRAAGAVSHTSLGDACREARASFARIARLVVRLVPHEDVNESLYVILEHAHLSFGRAASSECALMELVCVARMLHALGYLSTNALGSVYKAEPSFTPDVLSFASINMDSLLVSVNRALSETHL